MKAEGIEYDERMELLDDVTYPKPLEELLGHAFEVYLQSNPWAADAQLSPKSVVREMWERAFTFREFVSVYGLTRSEGAVLRYLSDAFKALRSGVPAAARTEEVTDIVEWLGELVRQVDSSLLDEWEQLTSPDQPLDAPVAVPARPRPLTGNERAFTAMVRNALFRRVELFARRRWYDLGELDARLRLDGRALGGGRATRTSPSTTTWASAPTPAGPALLIIDRQPGVWRVRQILDDPAGDHDWGFDVEVDLEASDEEGAAVLRLIDAGRHGLVAEAAVHVGAAPGLRRVRRGVSPPVSDPAPRIGVLAGLLVVRGFSPHQCGHRRRHHTQGSHLPARPGADLVVGLRRGVPLK